MLMQGLYLPLPAGVRRAAAAAPLSDSTFPAYLDDRGSSRQVSRCPLPSHDHAHACRPAAGLQQALEAAEQVPLRHLPFMCGRVARVGKESQWSFGTVSSGRSVVPAPPSNPLTTFPAPLTA